MDSLHRATELNNAGVQLLETNDISGAIKPFCDALNVMKDYMDTGKDIQLTTTFKDQNALFDLHHVVLAGMIDAIQSNSIQTSKLSEDTRGPYIYSRPIMLPDAKLFLSALRNDSIDLDMLLATAITIIVFNFALSCHLHSERSGAASTLKQALQLYNLAIRMIEQADCQPNFLQVLEYLALNNMASIYYYSSCDYKNSHHCLDCIKNLRVYRNIDILALEFLFEIEWTNLKLNLMVIQFPSAAQAA
jgi:hypothetical protein